MKAIKALRIFLLVLIIIGIGLLLTQKIWVPKLVDEILLEDQLPLVTEDSIVGCYVVRFNKDVYTLKILSQEGESFKGLLSFKNFEKDSSSGTFKGTYKDGILLGDYSFRSEGLDSVMQVIFKKSGNDFIRGYGDMKEEGTRFADLNNITYDSSSVLSVFKESKEGCVI